jgi:hypothetical protein
MALLPGEVQLGSKFHMPFCCRCSPNHTLMLTDKRMVVALDRGLCCMRAGWETFVMYR